MHTPPIYLDYNATAPLRPQALYAMQQALELPLNASSVHSYGREAKKILERSRKTLGGAVSAFPNEVVFCASGTEANYWALNARPDWPLLVSAVEHSSVVSAYHRHCGVASLEARHDGMIAVDENGVIRLEALHERLTQLGRPALVSLMLANNETGVIQPVAEAAEIVHAKGRAIALRRRAGFG